MRRIVLAVALMLSATVAVADDQLASKISRYLDDCDRLRAEAVEKLEMELDEVEKSSKVSASDKAALRRDLQKKLKEAKSEKTRFRSTLSARSQVGDIGGGIDDEGAVDSVVDSTTIVARLFKETATERGFTRQFQELVIRGVATNRVKVDDPIDLSGAYEVVGRDKKGRLIVEEIDSKAIQRAVSERKKAAKAAEPKKPAN